MKRNYQFGIWAAGFLVLAFMLCCAPAMAAQTMSLTDKQGEEYIYTEANTPDIIETAIMLDVVDLEEEKALETYARVHYCDIFTDYFENDFEWKKITEAIKDDFIQKVQNNEVKTRYYIRSGIAVDRYDFDKNIFPIMPSYQLQRVGDIEMHDFIAEEYCGRQLINTPFPTYYNVSTESAVNVDSFMPISEEAKKLVGAIPLNRKRERIVTAIFFMNLSGVKEGTTRTMYGNRLNFVGEIDKIVFYADAELTQPVGQVTLNEKF